MLKNIQVKLNVTILKPVNAGWLSEFCNHMTSGKVCNIIKNGWEAAAGITNAICLGLHNLVDQLILLMKWMLCCSPLSNAI